jgi:prephenate dehydratase
VTRIGPDCRVAFLGPIGTFTEEALLSQPDLAELALEPMATVGDVLAAVSAGTVELGFVPIENAIEGSVNVSLDALAFEHELLIQREVRLPITMHLMALPGVGLADVRRVLSIPVATAQCRQFLARELPKADVVAANSTAEAAQLIGRHTETMRDAAAVGPALSGKLYGLVSLAADIADHPENETRFVLVGREGVARRTGHDKTAIVCFQDFDRPGSLLAILHEFAARSINLVRLESRPTKKSLGEYCFVIDLEGHIGDEVVADCLREIRAKAADVKFLGSFPAAGEHVHARREEASAAWHRARAWMDELRDQIGR